VTLKYARWREEIESSAGEGKTWLSADPTWRCSAIFLELKESAEALGTLSGHACAAD
jgi:hypothetical protein